MWKKNDIKLTLKWLKSKIAIYLQRKPFPLKIQNDFI